MYLEAKETARLYKLLSDQLGSDTTEAMFKYIDNKTERSVEATIKTLATKDDIANLRKEIFLVGSSTKDDIAHLRSSTKDDIAILRKEMADEMMMARLASKDDISNLRKELGNDISQLGYKISKDMGESKADNTRWMFIFWVGQLAATLGVIFLFLKK